MLELWVLKVNPMNNAKIMLSLIVTKMWQFPKEGLMLG